MGLKRRAGIGSLIVAIECQSVQRVRELATTVSDLDKPNRRGQLALVEAAQRKSVPIVELLLEHGANPNVRTSAGTPLCYSTTQKRALSVWHDAQTVAAIDCRLFDHWPHCVLLLELSALVVVRGLLLGFVLAPSLLRFAFESGFVDHL